MSQTWNDAEMLALRTAQLDAYERNLALSALITALAAVLCSVLVWRHTPAVLLAPWAAAQLALSGWTCVRAWRPRAPHRAAAPKRRGLAQIRRAEFGAFAAAAVAGVLWGAGAVFFFYLPLELAFSLLLILLALASGAATSMVMLPQCSRVFSAACLLPLVPVLLIDPRVNSGILAALATVMLIAILAGTRQISRRLIEQLHSERVQRQLLLRTQEERVRTEMALERTKRRAAAEAVARRDAEAETKQMFENMAVGMFRTMPDGQLVRANPALVRFLGCRDEAEACATAGRAVDLYVEPSRRAELVRILEEHGKVANFVSEIFHPVTRSRLWIAESMWIVRDAAGSITFYEGIIEDVTDSVRTQSALEASQLEIRVAQERYELAVDGTSIGVWSWDAPNDRIERSRQCRILLGDEGPDDDTHIAASEFIRFVHFGDRATLIAARRTVFKTGEFETTIRFRCRNQSFRWFRLKGKAVRDDKGRVVRVAGSMQDVDELTRKQEEIGAAMSRAQETARTRSAFLAMMSHEIRTPMNGVIGMTRLLLDTELRPDQHHMASVIRESADSLLRIVNDILDLSKLDSGRDRLDSEPFDLMPMLNYTLEIVAPRARAKQLNLALRCSGTGPVYVRGDAGRLRQVLLNLLGNAVKFTDVGSVELAVTVAPSDAKRVKLGFAVTDTGIGIAKEAIGNLFQDFVQADSGISRKYGGTGLGLAISRRLVARMGGEISVVSTENVGSTFFFHLELPVAEAAEVLRPAAYGDAERAHARLLRAARPISVLVAEDNKTNRLIISRMLGEFSAIRLKIVEDGAQAVEAVRRERFDLVLMDVHMPVMDGIEASQAIRTIDGERAAVPIVAITAHAFAEDIARCRAAGMNGHVGKPFRSAELLQAIANHTGVPAEPGAEATAMAADRGAPASTNSAEAPPVFSQDTLERLASEIGGESIDGLVRVFVEQSRALIAGARSKSGDEGRAERVRAVHSVKSSAASVGAMALSALAAEMERRLKIGDAAFVETDFDRLNAELGAFVAEYEAASRPLQRALAFA